MARILIAEDSRDIRALIEMLLSEEGHEVIAVADGGAAVEVARRERPDLILMDLSLPVVSGWEATRLIRSDPAAAATPILAVTAHAMQGDRERALAAGCNGFIPKPIDEQTFARRVASFLATPPGRPAAAAESRRTRRDEPGRVLVVDDQPDVADLIRINLETDGHQVRVAGNAAEAAELFGEPDGFDLAVVDVMLGGESGYALTRRLTAGAAEYVPVLLLTAGTIDRERGYASGADDFIGMPVESVELRARARSLIRVGRAIREHRRFSRERSEAYRKLEELDHLKSDFLSTVSHELRTPLNTIILLAHQLDRGTEPPEDGARRARDIRLMREAAETLRQMIDNILDLAKVEAGQRDLHPQPVVLREFLRDTAELLEPQARGKGLGLEVEPASELPETVQLDRDKVHRVLVNLLSNAVKYTSSGRVVLRARPWQGSITFQVADTGRGIPPGLIARAFEPFQQIRARGADARGTGLGLSISKQLVEVMGGDLILESREGEGTTVTFTLPEIAAPENRPEIPTAPAGSFPLLSGRHPRILIIEDDDASRYGLSSLLESEGYRVEARATLREADDLLAAAGFDAIILDITLPDGDGAEWLTLRRSRGGDGLPAVVALTGVTADADRRRILASGVSRVLTKPVDVPRLLVVLAELSGQLSGHLSGPAPS